MSYLGTWASVVFRQHQIDQNTHPFVAENMQQSHLGIGSRWRLHVEKLISGISRGSDASLSSRVFQSTASEIFLREKVISILFCLSLISPVLQKNWEFNQLQRKLALISCRSIVNKLQWNTFCKRHLQVLGSCAVLPGFLLSFALSDSLDRNLFSRTFAPSCLLKICTCCSHDERWLWGRASGRIFDSPQYTNPFKHRRRTAAAISRYFTTSHANYSGIHSRSPYSHATEKVCSVS